MENLLFLGVPILSTLGYINDSFQQYFGYSVNCNSSNVALSYSLMEKHFLYPNKYGTYQKQSNVLFVVISVGV